MENNNRGNSGREGADNPRMASGQNERRDMQPEQTGQEFERNASQGGQDEWMEDESSESYNAQSEGSRGNQSSSEDSMRAGNRDSESYNAGSRNQSGSRSTDNLGE